MTSTHLARALATPPKEYRPGMVQEARTKDRDPERGSIRDTARPCLYDKDPAAAEASTAAALARLARRNPRYIVATGTAVDPVEVAQEAARAARTRRRASREALPAPVPAETRTRTQRGAPVAADPDEAPALPPEHPHWQQ